jgi:hypothetical protein
LAVPARVAFALALTATALSALVARTWATCACIASACVASSRVASRRAALAASGIPVPAACASGIARPAITTLSAAVSIGTAFVTPGAFPAPIAVATAASTGIATAASTAIAATSSTPIAPRAVTALGQGCPIEDGQAGAMAEVKLNPKGKSSSGACYRNEDMSPPTCHDHLMTASNARLRRLQHGEVMNRGRLVGAQHGTLKCNLQQIRDE